MIPLPARFAIVFAIPGLIVSTVFALLSGNRWEHITFVIILCTLLSAGLGAAVYAVLKAKVPEFFETFEGLAGLSIRGSQGSSSEFSEDELNSYPIGGGADTSDAEAAQAMSAVSGPSKHFGDHILVDKVKIKNEPKLMAQAIRTLLAKDD